MTAKKPKSTAKKATSGKGSVRTGSAKKSSRTAGSSKAAIKANPWPRIRVLGLAAMLALAAIGYSVLWQAVARRLISETDMQITLLKDAGFQVEYADIEVIGFPYRVTVQLSDPRIATNSGAVGLKADQLRFISHLWTPNQWVLEAVNSDIVTPFSGSLTLPILKASWRRLGESGQRLIVDASGASGTGPESFGRLETAVLGFVIPGEAERKASETLLGDKIAAITMRLKGSAMSLDGATVLSGAPIMDWSKTALATFRDQAGLWDLTDLTLKIDDYPIKIVGSLTLDLDLSPLGTLDLTPVQSLPKLAGPLGRLQSRLDLYDQPRNISLQNGSLFVDGTYKGDIEPLIKD